MDNPARKLWRLLPHDQAAIERLGRQLRVSPIVAQLLLNRRLAEPAEAERFMKCPLSGLHEPELLPGINTACDHLMAAIAEGRRICVYGDYDVDGVAATAILSTCLKLLGAQADIPRPASARGRLWPQQ